MCRRNIEALKGVLGEDNVDVIYIHDEGSRAKSRIVGAFYFLSGYFYGLTPKRVDGIVEKAMAYDYMWLDRSVFGIIAHKARRAGYKGRIMCFFHNIETVFFDAKLPGWLPGRNVVLRCVRRNDAYCCCDTDTVVALTGRDSEGLSRLYGREADFIAPVMFKDRYARESYPTETIPAKPLCVFLGSFFPANVEGVEWFVREVYHKVDITFKIVGKGMDQLKVVGKEWLDPGIEVISDAPQLEPFFVEADIMIIPIFKGSGMKVKTCESLMFGKNVLATDEAWVGYDLDYDRAGGRCNNASEYIRRINELASARVPRFNSYSREMFLNKWSDARAPELFRNILKVSDPAAES